MNIKASEAWKLTTNPLKAASLNSSFLHFKEPPWEEKVAYGLVKVMDIPEFFWKDRRLSRYFQSLVYL
jgi:hypothetical protein